MKITEKSQDLLIKVGVILAIYFLFGKPILNKIGITKSKSDRMREKELENPDSPFKTDYWRRYYNSTVNPKLKKLTLLEANELKAIAKKIFDGFGYFSDDEAAISTAFFRIKSKAKLSLVSWYFSEAYKNDLLSYLAKGKSNMPQNGLSDYDIGLIISYVNKLPKV